MNRMLFVSAVLVAVVCLCMPSVAGEKPAPGAFLNYRVDSVSGLVSQIDTEPRVAARYAEHFHVSPAALKDYLKNNVRLITLKRPTQAVEYFTKKGGGIGSDRRVLPAGTRVFATTSGELVLEWRCGNPLAARLPVSIQTKAEPARKPVPSVVSKAVTEAQPAALSTAPIEAPITATAPVAETTLLNPEAPIELAEGPIIPPAVSVLPSVETLAPAAVMTPVVPTTVPPAVAVTTSPAITAPPVIASSGGSKFPWIIPLLIGAGAGIAGGGGGNTPEPPVTPEPATLMLLSAGVAAVGFKIRTIKR